MHWQQRQEFRYAQQVAIYLTSEERESERSEMVTSRSSRGRGRARCSTSRRRRRRRARWRCCSCAGARRRSSGSWGRGRCRGCRSRAEPLARLPLGGGSRGRSLAGARSTLPAVALAARRPVGTCRPAAAPSPVADEHDVVKAASETNQLSDEL
jgi:hypothetical protein